MFRLVGRSLAALMALGLLACGKVDSLVGAVDSSNGTGGVGGEADATGSGGRGAGAPGSGGSSGKGSDRGGSNGTDTGGAGVGTGAGAGTGGAAGTGTGGQDRTDCDDTPITVPPRIVRLTFAQLTSSVVALLSDNGAAEVRTALAAELDSDQTFPPLTSPREGDLVDDAVFASSDRLAQLAGKFVRESLRNVSGCPAPQSDACALAFLRNFTELAYRRPAAEVEVANILQVYTEAKDAGASVEEAVEAAVTAVFDSPIFVYRTEFGASAATGSSLELAPHELASELAFFLTNAPPDSELLDAASRGKLNTATELSRQIDRLLAGPAARANLTKQVANYFGLPKLQTVAIDVPAFTAELRASMQTESLAFFQRQLWDAPLAELLTTRESRIDARLAELYGIAFPPPGATLDAAGFADVELPEQRSGLLTQAAMLTTGSLPLEPSVVQRGWWVNATMLCRPVPGHPDQVKKTDRTELSERERSAYRTATVPCVTCHQIIDPPGLALGNFDAIGQYRTADAEGRPIDSSARLSDEVGGQTIDGPAELASALLQGDEFHACLARAFLNYALADATLGNRDSCAQRDVVSAYRSGEDPSFSGLLRQIALSKLLLVRQPAP